MKTYRTIKEAILNAVLPEEYKIKQEQFKTGVNQNKWLEMLDENPPKTTGRLTRIDSANIVGHCCLGVWCYNQGIPSFFDDSCATYISDGIEDEVYLPQSEIVSLGLRSEKGDFNDNLHLYLVDKDSRFYAVFDNTGFVTDYTISTNNIALLNDSHLLEDHKTMAQFIRNFSSIIFTESK